MENDSNAFENAVREYFVSLRWHERALENVEKAREDVKRAGAAKQQSLNNLKDFVENVDEVARACSALVDPL